MKEKILSEIEEHIVLLKDSKETITNNVIEVSVIISKALKSGNKVILFGNGGSAADAQHIAAEFTGRFVKERKGLPAIALTTDTSALTAIGNDYGFDKIFERQVDALAQSGDILIGITTSGNSINVLNALQLGKNKSCICISFTGNNGGLVNEISDYNINVDHKVTARIQEMHILVGHLICSYIDEFHS